MIHENTHSDNLAYRMEPLPSHEAKISPNPQPHRCTLKVEAFRTCSKIGQFFQSFHVSRLKNTLDLTHDAPPSYNQLFVRTKTVK